ncbi:MAG TPA: DUF4129 domain-containing protein, partial [Terriglobia bacterium]|nr:DUF4129 domain-containing protein [Terriglobia bacterium]
FQQAQASVEKIQRSVQTRKDVWFAGAHGYVKRITVRIRETIHSGVIWIYGAVFLTVAVLYLKRKYLWSQWWLYRLRKTGRVDARVIDALFYRAVAIVAKRGTRRQASETWREWIGIVPHERCRSVLHRALEVFERSRYGPDPSSPADVAVLQEAVRELRSLLQ